MTFSMKWPFADRYFTRRWHLVRNRSNLPNQMRPSGSRTCPNLIPRGPNQELPSSLRRLTLPRKPNGILRGLRSYPMAPASVFDTTWAPVAPASHAGMRTNAPFRNPMGSHAPVFTWLRSIQRRPTDQVIQHVNRPWYSHWNRQTSPFRTCISQCLWTNLFQNRMMFLRCPIFRQLGFSLTFSQAPPAQLAQL